MNESTTLERLAAANPAPSHGMDFDDTALLLAIQERSVDMSTNTEHTATKGIPPLTDPEPPNRRGWLIAVAAFAVVIVLGIAVVLTTTSTDVPPATTPPTTEAPAPSTTAAVPPPEAATTTTVAPEPAEPTIDLEAAVAEVSTFLQGMVNDMNAGAAGVDIVAAYFPPAPEACGDVSKCANAFQRGPMTYEWLDEWFDHQVLLETTYELGECRPRGDTGIVACEMLSTSPHQPYHPDAQRIDVYEIRLEDGDITYAHMGPQIANPWRLTEWQFETWLVENHPDVANAMYIGPGTNPGGEQEVKIQTDLEGFVDNLKRYVAEWRASQA